MAELIPHAAAWPTALVTLTNLLVGGLLVAIVRTRPVLRRIANEREANLLHERAEQMEAMQRRLEAMEAKIESERARHQAERALDRQQLANFDQCFAALFLMVEQAPEKAADAIAAVKLMRARQLDAEALARAALHAAALHTSGGPTT